MTSVQLVLMIKLKLVFNNKCSAPVNDNHSNGVNDKYPTSPGVNDIILLQRVSVRRIRLVSCP